MAELSCQGYKGNWIALYIISPSKVLFSLILMIVAIQLMTHPAADCGEIEQCFDEGGHRKCSWLEDPEYNDCWNDETIYDCTNSSAFLSKFSKNLGIAMLIGSLAGIVAGGFGVLSAWQKLRRWLSVTMTLDILLMLFGGVMLFISLHVSAEMGLVCALMELHEEDKFVQCWDPLVGNFCTWAQMFGTACWLFLVAFLVQLGSSIVGCNTLCCCPPIDAHWAKLPPSQMAQPVGGAVVVGNPVVGNAVQGQPAQVVGQPVPGVVVGEQPKV